MIGNRLYRTINQTIKEMGWWNAGAYTAGRIMGALSGGRWTLYQYRFFAQSVSPASLCRGRGQTIAVRPCLQSADLPRPYPRCDDVIQQRYAQGAYSIAATKNGELTGTLWLAFKDYYEDEVRACYRLTSLQSAWDFDVWVLPEARLGPTFARLWDEANRILHARSIRWTCSRISTYNAASLAAHARIGNVELGTALFLRCGQWQWTFATIRPYFHLSRHAISIPQFHFDTDKLIPKECP